MRRELGGIAAQSRGPKRARPTRTGRRSVGVELDRQARVRFAHALQADEPSAVGTRAGRVGELDRDADGLVGIEEDPGARDVVALAHELARLEAHRYPGLQSPAVRPPLVRRPDTVAVLHLWCS